MKLSENDVDKRIETLELLREMSVEKKIESLYFIDFHRFSPNLKLENVAGISKHCTEAHEIVEMFPNLKMINVQIQSLRKATEMAKQFQHLEEAFIDVNHLDFIIPFIRFTPKLKTIYLNNTDSIRSLPNLNLIKLIKQRKKLANAANVMIYFKEEAYLKIKSVKIFFFITADNILLKFCVLLLL